MAIPKILCVAEKPAIAKAVATHLSGGSMRIVSSLQPGLRHSRYSDDRRDDGAKSRRITSVAIHMSRTTYSTSTLAAPGARAL